MDSHENFNDFLFVDVAANLDFVFLAAFQRNGG